MDGECTYQRIFWDFLTISHLLEISLHLLPKINLIDKTKVLFLKLKSAVDFSAPDKKYVDLVFVILAPKNCQSEHLLVLSSISSFVKNKNFTYYKNFNKLIFFEFKDQLTNQSFKEFFKIAFSSSSSFLIKFIENLSDENLLKTTNELVHFGWKKEAIPMTLIKKSLIARFFKAIFG